MGEVKQFKKRTTESNKWISDEARAEIRERFCQSVIAHARAGQPDPYIVSDCPVCEGIHFEDQCSFGRGG